MSRLIITHSDLDGLAVVVLHEVYKALHGESFDSIISENYGFEETPEKLELLASFDEIFFTDLSVPEPVLDMLLEKHKVEIYDHHDSTLYLKEKSHPNLKVFHDLSRGGTQIFFEEYYQKKYSRHLLSVIQFVELVSTYDLWKKTSPLWQRATNLNRILFRQYDWDKTGVDAAQTFILRQTKKLLEANSFEFTKSEEYIIQEELEKEDKRYDEALSKMKIRKDSHGMVFGVTLLSSKISLVASRILESTEFDCLDYLVVFNNYKGNEGKVSARSSRGFDCTSLGVFNGHTAAAGGEISSDEARFFYEHSQCFVYKEDHIEGTPLYISCEEA